MHSHYSDIVSTGNPKIDGVIKAFGVVTGSLTGVYVSLENNGVIKPDEFPSVHTPEFYIMIVKTIFFAALGGLVSSAASYFFTKYLNKKHGKNSLK